MDKMRYALVIVAGLAGVFGQASWSQEAPKAAGASAIVTIDQERLYAESLWGKRAVGELEAASRALQAENREIESNLAAEEKSLTKQRETLAPAEFRKLADEFDARVTAIRKEQETKARELAQKRDTDRQAFFDAALAVMGDVMSAQGAVAMLDSRAIFLSVTSIDVTDKVIAGVDEKIGAGPSGP